MTDLTLAVSRSHMLAPHQTGASRKERRAPAQRSASQPEGPLHAAADSFVPRLSVTFRHAFSLGRQALRATRDPDAAADAISADLRKTLPKALLDVAAEGGRVAAEALVAKLRTAEKDSFRTLRPRRPPISFTFSRRSPNVIAWAQRHAGELITQVSDTTRRRVRQIIVNLIDEEGGDWNEAWDAISSAVGDADRAELIARNEVMRAASEGQRQAWEQAVENELLTGDERRVWITTPDARLCPICEELEGETSPLGGEYPGGYVGPPAHVNCRCTEGII